MARRTEGRTAPLRLLVIGNGPTGVSDDGSAHVERQLGELMFELDERGYAVSFVQAMIPFTPGMTYFGMIMPSDRVATVPFWTSALLRGMLRLVRAIWRADFVHIFFPGTLPRVAARICRALGKPYGFYLRGQQFSSDADAGLLRRARYVLAVSPGLLAETAGLPVTVIRPMIEISPADAFERDHAPLGSRPIRLLFIGRLAADKGVPELVKALALLQERGVAAELRLVGGGPLEGELAERSRADPALGLRIVGVVGDRAEVMRMLEEADAFGFPTHHEGFPRVLYEAMIKSAPVVTTMVGGIPAVMTDGENCLGIPVADAVAIADAIQRLAEDHDLRQRLAQAGLATVKRILTERPTHFDALCAELEAMSAGGR